MLGRADPRTGVDAPIRAALDAIILRGALCFAGAVLVVIGSFDMAFHPVGHVALPVALLAYVAYRAVVRLVRPGVDGSGAWERAAGVDRSDARVARAVVLFVPAGYVLAGLSLASHHLGDPASVGFIAGVVAPLYGLLWIAAAGAWLDEARDRLARAALESDRLLRAYWAGVGSSGEAGPRR